VIDLVEMEFVSSVESMTSLAMTVPVVRGSALGALNGEKQWGRQDRRADGCGGQNVPQPDRLVDLPFLMPIEDIFSISGVEL